jgi:hypothetical protein
VSFRDWVNAQPRSLPLPGSDPNSLLTQRAWDRLWERRPRLAWVDAALDVTQSIVGSTSEARLFETLMPLVPEIAAYPKITMRTVPSPGLLVYCETAGQGLHVTMEEGFARFVGTMLAFGLHPLLGRRSNVPAQPFLTGCFARDARDTEPLIRALRAYGGTIRLTGGNHLPLVAEQSPVSEPVATWLTAGALALAVFHEVGHFLAPEVPTYRPESSLNESMNQPGGVEAYCDLTAAHIALVALADFGEFSQIALAGAFSLPRVLTALDGFRFLIRPSTHPSPQQRAELIASVWERYLPRRIIDEISHFLSPGNKTFKLGLILDETAQLEWRPRSTNHLANCLPSDGSVQFLLSDDSGGLVEPTEDDEENTFLLCSLAITGAEECLRQRTVAYFHHFAVMGTILSEGDPRDRLSDALIDAATAELYRRSPGYGRELDKKGDDARATAITAYIAAVIGQHYFWTVFVGENMPRLLADAAALHRDGVTHDDVARAFPSVSPDLLLSAVRVMDRLARKDEGVFPVDESLAAELFAAVGASREPDRQSPL